MIRNELFNNKHITNKITINNKTFLFSAVKNVRNTIGYLCLEITTNNNLDFLNSVLEHASLAISQIILRNEIVEERKQFSEDEIVQGLLLGKNESLVKLDSFLPFSYKNSSCRIMIIMLNDSLASMKNGWNELKIRIAILIRDFFTRLKIFPIISFREKRIVIISFTLKENTLEDGGRGIYEKVSRLINRDPEFHALLNEEFEIGISKNSIDFENLQHLYGQAMRVIELQHYKLSEELLYDNIGVYDILFQMGDLNELHSFVETYLGDILKLESKIKEELLTTLEAVLDSNGSLRIAAQRLFVVRQTIYYRLKKLQEILGEDFMESPYRLALEISVKAHRYLSAIKS